jgi:hypothetical protein
MIYIAGFGLVFIGFCLGFIVAILCACAGRADEKIAMTISIDKPDDGANTSP